MSAEFKREQSAEGTARFQSEKKHESLFEREKQLANEGAGGAEIYHSSTRSGTKNTTVLLVCFASFWNEIVLDFTKVVENLLQFSCFRIAWACRRRTEDT